MNSLRHFETLRLPPLRRTLRACDHVTRAQYFKVLWRVRFVDAYKFFSFCKSFCSFLFTLVVCHLPVYLLGLNLEFEPTIQGELFLNTNNNNNNNNNNNQLYSVNVSPNSTSHRLSCLSLVFILKVDDCSLHHSIHCSRHNSKISTDR